MKRGNYEDRHPMDGQSGLTPIAWRVSRGHKMYVGMITADHKVRDVWLDAELDVETLYTAPAGLLRENEALRTALQKIAALVDSEIGEPLDEAVDIAAKALAGDGAYQLPDEVQRPDDENKASNLIKTARSILVLARIEAGENHSPGTNAAIAWRTIGKLDQILGPSPLPSQTRGSP